MIVFFFAANTSRAMDDSVVNKVHVRYLSNSFGASKFRVNAYEELFYFRLHDNRIIFV
jgi:hypothetical protein